MLVHMVLFRFSNPDDAIQSRDRLLAMRGRIPGLLGVEAGLDVTHSERSYDLGLITRHESSDALDLYQEHPVHQDVVAFIRPRTTAAAAVDFLVSE